MNAIEATAPTISDFELGGDKRIVVDVTSVSGQNFFSGVQRVVRSFVEANADELLLVRFDPKNEVFRIIPRLTRLRYRRDQGFLAGVRRFFKSFYWSASKNFREEGDRRTWLPRPIREVARWIYDQFLSDTYIEKRDRLALRPEWVPKAHQTFLLLDIPVNIRHTEALSTLCEAESSRVVVYVHDLFPLSHKHLFNPKHHPGVRARHLRYLDVVGGADIVVCNSEFTAQQYRRFVDLLEESPIQEVSVVYPPWPQWDSETQVSTRESAHASSIARGEFGDAAIKVLAVGGLNQRKNMVVLVRAVKELVARGDSVMLIVVAGHSVDADAALRAELHGLDSVELESIAVLEATPNDVLMRLYDQASVVAVPSLAEGFGLPVVEALSRDRPVVASNATAIPELAMHLPIILVDPVDVNAWADALADASRSGLKDPVVPPPVFPADWNDFRERLLPRGATVEADVERELQDFDS